MYKLWENVLKITTGIKIAFSEIAFNLKVKCKCILNKEY